MTEASGHLFDVCCVQWRFDILTLRARVLEYCNKSGITGKLSQEEEEEPDESFELTGLAGGNISEDRRLR